MPTGNPEISIIVVSFNTVECLKRCLAHLGQEADGPAFEIIVVDNASIDGSGAMVRNCFPHVKLIQNSNNEGFGAANNKGVENAAGSYLIFLNPDAFPKQDAFSTALKMMKETPQAGIGGARLVNPSGSPEHSARSFPTVLHDFLRLSGLADRYPRSRFFGHAENTWAPLDKPMQVDWVTGAFMIIPKKVYQHAGGFDERFFLYYEEIDLCKRVKSLGYQVWYWPDIVVEHAGGISTEQTPSKRTLWMMLSALLYYRKHHGFLGAYSSKLMHQTWHRLRIFRHILFKNNSSPQKIEESKSLIRLMDQAWKVSEHGTFSPAKPW